jgi:hypothetical protein
MTDSHLISALRLKRAEIGGHIHDLEKRIARQRANLANLDATIRLFSPGANPDAIPPKHTINFRDNAIASKLAAFHFFGHGLAQLMEQYEGGLIGQATVA